VCVCVSLCVCVCVCLRVFAHAGILLTVLTYLNFINTARNALPKHFQLYSGETAGGEGIYLQTPVRNASEHLLRPLLRGAHKMIMILLIRLLAR
jgi:hypothetical protein